MLQSKFLSGMIASDMKHPALLGNDCGSVCATPCEAVLRAATLPLDQRRRKASLWSLAALFVPASSFPVGLWWIGHQDRFRWVTNPNTWPWELWALAIFGTAALAGGLGDWAFHRWMARCIIGRAERRCELLALAGGGIPMFLIMATASISDHPQRWLLPALVVLIYTTALICYDEFVYHRRRCQRLETLLHRTLVFGNGLAWLAWAQWCFVRGGVGGHA